MNSHYRRSHPRFRGRPKKRLDKVKSSAYENPRLDPLLKKIFIQIGIPKKSPFIPDPFQLEALEKIKNRDVLVTAPTGSGKTWIASQAIKEYISRDKKVWYASPLKALSNSLYLQFVKEFGEDKVGILTGERKENGDASIVVGTTEILRNQLYDAMKEGHNIGVDLVILDEAHYLGDPDRGVVWEEVLIYLPSRVRLLLLSATISNSEEFSKWLEKNRSITSECVCSKERSVPLEILFMFPDGLISPLSAYKGLSPKVKKFVSSQKGHNRRRGYGKTKYHDLLNCLREFNLLPAIFFLKSRRDCDHAVFDCHGSKLSAELKKRMESEKDAILDQYPHLKGHRQMEALMNSRVASHHAGQLPYWKLFVERMMNKGLLEAIFATSTVAAGVNFPARTVVIVQSDRFNGHEFADLTATDLHQMIGRAGRRGMDNIGFTLVIPGVHQDPQLIHDLIRSPPEPLISQIHINFSMALNLLLSHAPLQVQDLLNNSFANFQERNRGSFAQRRWLDIMDTLVSMLPNGRCDTSDPYEVIENIRKRAEIKKEFKRGPKGLSKEKMISFLKPGRIFHHKGKGIYVLFYLFSDQKEAVCHSHNVKKPVRFRKGRIRLRRIPFGQIRFLYDYKIDLPETYTMEELQDIFDHLDIRKFKPLDPYHSGDEKYEDRQKRLNAKLDNLPCIDCDHGKDCHRKKNGGLGRLLNEFRSMARSMEGSGQGLWISFKRHVRFLRETGFVDDSDRLTPDGEWASKLRLDQPLLIAEAIRNQGFDHLSPEMMAGCVAPFVWDRDLDVDIRIDENPGLKDMENALRHLTESISSLRELQLSRGFENPPLYLWSAMAMFLWACGTSWEKLLYHVPVGEGDMAGLIIRTADHLRQIVNLKDSHPELSAVARSAIELIYREPVFLE